MASLRNMLLLSVAVTLVLPNAGCPPQPQPPAEAVLAGTWTLTDGLSTNPDLSQVLLNFDADGNLVSVTYVFQNATATRALANTSTDVNGAAVSIASTTAGFTLNFAGTLSNDDTLINGTASWTLVIGNVTINSQLGPALLVKGSITANVANGQALYNDECLGCHPTPASLAPDLGKIVNDLGTVSPGGAAMTGVILTNQEVADVRAYLASL